MKATARLKLIAPILFLVLAPLLVLWPAVFQGKTIGPWDNIAPLVSSSALERPPQPWDVLQADAVLQFYPWRDMVFESWHRHELPLWNPYELCGTPLLANSQSAGFYPFHIVIGLLGIGTSVGITILAWLHLALAGVGTYGLVRRLGGNVGGGVIAGLGFGLSAFMVAWMGLASVITTCCWIPFVFWGIVALFRGEGKLWRALAGTAAATGMMMLGGHLQFAAYGILGAVILSVGLAVSSQGGLPGKVRCLRLGMVAVGLALGGMISAIQLLPVLQYSKFSHRAGVATSEGYQAYVANALTPRELFNLSDPNGLGNSSEYAKGDAPISDYGPVLTKRGANFAESAVTVGPVILILLLYGLNLWKRHDVPLAFIALATLSLLIALGTPFAALLYFGIPGWSSTGSPARILVLFVLSACVMAGLAYTRARQNPVEYSARSCLVAGTGALLVYFLINIAVSQKSLTTIILVGYYTAVAIVFLLYKSYGHKYTAIFFMIPFACNLVSNARFGSGEVEKMGFGDDRIAVINTSWSIVLPPNATYPPNLLSVERQAEVGGYDSLIHRDTVAMLKELNGGKDPAPPENGNMMFVKSADPETLRKLGEMGVSKVILRNWTKTGEFTAVPGEIQTISIPTQGRAFTPGGLAKIVRDGYDHQTIQALGPGPLIVRDVLMPGWTAWIGGREVPLKENGRWREVDLSEAKDYTVEFKYEAPGLRTGAWLTLVGLLSITGLLILGRENNVPANG